MNFENHDLFPITAETNKQGHLIIGNCDVTELASEFGTPLYIYDEDTLRWMCKEFVREFTSRYSETKILYASKAFINPAIAKIVHEEGLGVDVVSGGELALVQASGIPPEHIYFHGNNKTPGELVQALDAGVGRIVVDGFSELDLLETLAKEAGIEADIMLRLSPGVDPHTHVHTTTGTLDSKFGFSVETGDAALAIKQALNSRNLNIVGLHYHLGSPIFELEPYVIALDVVLSLASQFIDVGLELTEISPGGGFAIGYVKTQMPPSIGAYADTITTSLKQRCSELGFGTPKLVIEPGRSIVGRAGVAVYTVGAIKNIPGVRKYVSLDGGMGDNIRPALYDASYEAVVANNMFGPIEETVTLAGKYCESGDLLIKDVPLPILNSGDLVAIPSSGAYGPSMASNYNLNLKPPIVVVKNGMPKLIRRRETYQDLMRLDVFE